MGLLLEGDRSLRRNLLLQRVMQPFRVDLIDQPISCHFSQNDDLAGDVLRLLCANYLYRKCSRSLGYFGSFEARA